MFGRTPQYNAQKAAIFLRNSGFLYVYQEKINQLVLLKRSFELLNQNCKFGYRYEIWTGDEFGLKVFDIKPLVEKYFPDFYYNYFPNIKS